MVTRVRDAKKLRLTMEDMVEIIDAVNEHTTESREYNKECSEEYNEESQDGTPIFECNPESRESVRAAFLELIRWIPFWRTRTGVWFPLNPDSELMFKVRTDECEWLDTLDTTNK